MRVISGKYKGRIIKGFDIVGTRPTMDRVKESLFAMINNKIKDSVILDLFAGSGNLGIEAISNGALNAYFVDNNAIATKTIKENIENLKITENTFIYKMDYKKALDFFQINNIKFNIIFLDPPYKENILNEILEIINEYNLLLENGIIVLEYEKCLINNKYYKILKEKKYSDKNIMILEK